MLRGVGREVERSGASRVAISFPEWAIHEVNRLLAAREGAQSTEEQARLELQIAVLCDTARRYGRSLEEAAEI